MRYLGGFPKYVPPTDVATGFSCVPYAKFDLNGPSCGFSHSQVYEIRPQKDRTLEIIKRTDFDRERGRFWRFRCQSAVN